MVEKTESTLLTKALAAWKGSLGPEHVITDPSVLAAASRCTYATSQKVTALLRPADRHEVQRCVNIARQNKQKIYPISTGKNWGYGSAVPVEDGCVVLDLRRLDRIVDYSEELAYVTIEPGVTQEKLYAFLQDKGGKLWMDATGASKSAGLVGNVLERGSGHNPYADHFSHVCAMEVVLPNGECIHTGLDRFGNAKAAPVFRWGVGPYLDGLFTQSNFGIVTRMTVWLMPAPERFEAYFFNVTEDSGLETIIDALRPLRLRGIIQNALHIGNVYRLLPSFQQYPWREANGATPLPPDVLENLAGQYDIGAWNGAGALYGTRGEVAEARRQLKKALKGKVKKLHFVSDRQLELAARYKVPLTWLLGIDIDEMLTFFRPVYDMFKGKPTNKFIASTYWRKKEPPPQVLDPDKDGCGNIWLTPMCPMDGNAAREMADLTTETILSHGFEPGMTMTLLTERCIDNVISIMYDRDVEGEDERAMACYRDLLGRLTAQGFYPYRLGTHAMNSLQTGESEHGRFVKVLKAAVDPDSILAPGRYV